MWSQCTFLANMYADRISLCVHGRILAATFKSKQDIIFGLENRSSLNGVAARENRHANRRRCCKLLIKRLENKRYFLAKANDFQVLINLESAFKLKRFERGHCSIISVYLKSE